MSAFNSDPLSLSPTFLIKLRTKVCLSSLSLSLSLIFPSHLVLRIVLQLLHVDVDAALIPHMNPLSDLLGCAHTQIHRPLASDAELWIELERGFG